MRAQTRKRCKQFVLLIGLLAVGWALGGCELLWLTAPGVPTGVSASDGDYLNQIVITWQNVARAIRYEIWRALSADGTYDKIGESATNTYADTSFTANTTYWYRVKACNRGGCSDLSQPDSGYAVGQGTPAAPTGVSATDGAYLDRVRVTWTAAPGATQYQIWRDVAQGGPYTLRGTVTGTTYDDRDASPGVVYWYKVKACNASGCSAFSVADSGFTFASAPDPVTNVSASDGAHNDRVVVTWTASAGAATYQVHRSATEGGTYDQIGTSTTTTYNDTSVTVGTTYWYRVRACNTAGCSPFSVPDSGFASAGGGGGGGGGGTPALPGQPQNVRATDGEFADKIRVTWSSVSGATRYEVWRADSDTGTATQIAETTGTSYDDLGTTLCQEKWYEVRSCNAAGCGPWSVRDSGYRGASLKNVDGSKLKATVVWTSPTAARVDLEWVHIENNVTYSVQYEIWRSSPGIPWARIATVGTNTYSDSTVALGTTYSYKIRACSTQTCIQCSAFTGEVQAVIACNPGAPTGTINAVYAGGQVTVTWTTVAGATKYQVFRSTSATGTYDYVGETTGPVGTFSHTSAPGKYYYKVKTCVTCGCGPLSAASNEVTVPSP